MFEDQGQDPVESFGDFVSRTSTSAPAKRKPAPVPAPSVPAPGSFGEFVQRSKSQRQPDGPEVPDWALRQQRTIDVVPDALDFRGPTEGDKLVDRAMTAAGAVAPPPTEARIGRTAFARKVRPQRSAAAVASDDAAAQSFQRSTTPEWTDNEPLTPEERHQASEGFLASLALDKQAREQEAKAAVEAEARRAPKDAFSRVGGNFARGVVSGAGQPIEMMATDDRHPVLKEVAAKTLGDIEDVAREYFPLDHRDPAKLNPFKGDFYSADNAGKILTESIPYAAGTTVPFAAISAGAGGVASLLAPEAAAAEVIPRMTVADAIPAWAARRLPSRLAARELTEGVTGADLVGRASASATGASSTAAQEYEAAKRAGMSDNEAARSAAIGAVIGMSEGLGAPSTVGQFRRGAHIANEAIEEALQEGFSQAATGVNAKYLTGYDPNKPVSEIAGEAAGNALVGGAVGGLMATPGGISKPHTAPSPQTHIRPQIDERSRLNEAALAQAATSPAAPAAPTNQGGTQANPQPAAPPQSAPAVLFPNAQVQPAVEDLSSLSPTDRVAKLLERTKQMREGKTQANVEQQLNKEFTEASGLLDAAEQGWDVDRPTAELYVQAGAKRLKAALGTLQSSPGFQAELQAAASGQPLPATPYTTAVRTIQDRLANADALVNRDADIERIQKEGQTEVDRIQKELQVEADQAQKEQVKLQRRDAKEQAKFDRKAQKEEDRASRLEARRQQQEANKKARQVEMENQRQTAQNERDRKLAVAELQRISAHNAALQQADEAGRRSLQYHNEGRTSEAVAELVVQQNQIRDAVKYLPRTPDAQAVKADLNRYSGQIGNRIGDLRRQMRGGRSGRGEVTQPIPSLLSADAIVNPEGGVPRMPKPYEEAHYQPGSSFQRLAEEQRDETEETTPLLTAIRRLGGIRDDGITGGELRRLGVKESGTTGIANRNGSPPDRMREMLASEGYLPDDSTVSDLFDAIEAEMRGGSDTSEEESFDEYYRRLAEEERNAQRRGDGEAGRDSFEEYLARQDRRAENVPTEGRADNTHANDSFTEFLDKHGKDLTDEEAEDFAAYERTIKRSLSENPRPYGERTRPPEPGSSGLSFSGFNIMLRRNGEKIERLRTMDLNSPKAQQIISEIEADNARMGLEDNRSHLTPHLEELITMIMSDQFEALAEEEETLLDQIGDEAELHPEEDRPAIDREIAALDLVFEDKDLLELLEVASRGDDNAASQFIDYGTQFYGITEQTAQDLIETRRAARAARRENLAHHDAPRPAQQAPSAPEKLTDREVQLLRTNPSDVFDEQFDSYMHAIEDLHARAVRGEVDVDPGTIYDPARWVGVPSDVVSRLIENKSAPRAPLLNRIHGNRGGRVEKNRLPARENVEIINKYKNADLLRLAKPTRANRMSRLTQIINAAKITVEKNPSGASKVWMGEVRDLLERALAARAQYEKENPPKAPAAKPVPGAVVHPDPKLDGKPVLARTSDGRVVVENPDNKGGVSIVKDRSGEVEGREFVPLAGPTDPAVIKNRKREIGKLMPFNIQGNKSDLLAKGLGALMERAAKGTRRMIDAFAGSGTYTHYMRSRKIANQGDILNEFEPLRYIAHKQLRDNPEAVAAEADRVVADLRKLTAPIREGEPFSDTHDRIRQQVAAYFQGRLRALVVEGESLNERGRTGEPVEMVDSPETAGIYLVLQNQSFNFLPVQAEVSAPTVSENQSAFNFYEEDAAAREPKFRLPGFGVISNEGGKVGLFAHGRERILQSGSRAIEAGRRMQGVDVRRGDGWALIGREAKAGDLVPVDTSYLNRGSQETSNYNKATAEDAVPAIYNEKVRKNLLPAWDRGAKLVITNNWDEGVASFLRSLGFRLVKAFRQGASKDDIQSGGAAELIAVNFDPATGEFFERRRDDAPGVAAEIVSRPALDRRGAAGGQVESGRLAGQPEGKDAAVRGRGVDSGNAGQLTEEPSWVTEARARVAGGRPQLPDQVDVVGYETYRPGMTRPEWTNAVTEKLGRGAQRFTDATWQRLQPPPPKIHRRVEETPAFYSQLERTIEAKMPAKASADQVRAILINPQNGVKADEVKWSGLDDFLRDKRSVTKQEVSEFLAANRIEVRDVMKGGAGQYENSEDGLSRLIEDAAADPGLWEKLDTGVAFDNFEDTEERAMYLASGNPEAAGFYITNVDHPGEFVQYADHVLPGAKPDSYRELLLTLPRKKQGQEFADEYNRYFSALHRKYGDGVRVKASQSELDELDRLNSMSERGEGENYTSGHFDDPNVLAHVRFNDRTDADGKRVLFLEEIQSDWHQKGRKSGYREKWPQAKVDRFTVDPTTGNFGYWTVRDGDGYIIAQPPLQFNKTPEAALALVKKSALDGTLNGMGRVPDAPFKKNWHEFAFKRMLRYAAEKGYDRVAWTTGEQQADRYDLSKHVDRLALVRSTAPGDNGQLTLFAYKGGRQILAKETAAEELPDIVGKDVAQRLLDQPESKPSQFMTTERSLSGVDLRVGGEGMKGFYDRILPAFAAKYGKKWGTRVEQIDVGPKASFSLRFDDRRQFHGELLRDDNNQPLTFKSSLEAESFIQEAGLPEMEVVRNPDLLVHSVQVTPEMRASVMKGQPLFRKEPVFYSQLERTINAKMPAKASAAQIRAIIENPQSGVKADELKWTGLDDLLERGGHFTKEQVLDHLRQNRVQFDEVVKGARPGVERRLPPDQIVRRLNEEDADIFGEPVGSWGLFSVIEVSDEDDLIVPLGNWPTYEHAVDAAFASAEEAGIDYEEHMGAVSNTDAKFSHYTLPGERADYTELLLTLPVEDRTVRELPAGYKVEQPRPGGDGWTVYDPQGRDYGYGDTREQAIEDALRLLNDLAEPSEGVYNSSHYGEPNILAHVRFDTRTDADGKRILFLEEVQSDWHQEGRKRGYKPNSRDLDALDKELEQALSVYNQALARWREATGGRNVAVFDSTPEGAEMLGRLRELQQSRYPSGNAVPDAPFKKTWHELVFKRMLRHAAENGFDRMGWTTGAQQADRYDLAKQVSEIRVYKRYNGDGFNVNARGLNGEMVVMQHAKTADDLADLIGKDAAQKALDIIESGNRLPTGEQAAFLRGDDLKVGGSGMRGFYDKILPAFASKYAKKWGVKVGETSLADAYGHDDATIPRDRVVNHPAFIRDREQGLSYDDAYMNAEGEIFQERAAQQGFNKIHFIDVTPAMRESVLEGQPLFQKPGAQGLPGLTEADLPQIIADARVTFKSGKRGAPGTVYANDSASHILRAAFKEIYGEDADLLNFNTESSVIQAMVDVIEKDAGDAYFQAKTRKQLRAIARELRAAADAADTVSVIFADKGRGFSDIAKSRRHELTHAAQSGLQNSRGFLQGHRFGRVIADHLAEMGYALDDRTMEAAAFVAGGEWQRVGLTEQQGREFLHDYFDDIARTNGREALERFVTLAPKIKSALAEVKERYGTQRQDPAGSERGAAASGDGESSEARQSSSGGSKVSRRVEPGAEGHGRADGKDSSEPRGKKVDGRGFSIGPLENEPTGPIAASALGVLQQAAAGKNPKTTPLREIVAEHRPILVDPLKIQDQALEAIVKAGVARTLPGARALHWADKLKARGLTNRLANRQAKFIEDAIARTSSIIEASERMGRADRGGAEYQKAKKELQQLRRELHAQLAKLSDYSGPVEYAAKYSKAALLTAAHILTNNILDQVASFPLHEAQKMLGFMLPVKALQKWGVDVERSSVDFRDLVPAIAREFGAVLRGTKDALPDIVQMLRYGTTDLLLDEEVARQQADDLDEEGRPRTGGADRYELGKRARGVPGLDQTIAAIGRMHGAADAFGRRWALTTALTAQANAIAKKVGKEHGLSAKEIKDLAVDLASEPSPQMMVLAADEANRFILDFPTFIHNAIQTLRKVGSSDPKHKLANLAFNRALDFVVKFEKIPLAAQMQSLVHYSPVGLIGQAYSVRQASLAKKAGKPISKADSAEIAERLRQAMLGTLMWAGVGVLGSLGYLQFTGGGDDRDRVRNAEGALGENPFEPELVVGDTAFGINKLGVVGRAGSLAARVATAARRRTDPLTGEQEPASKVATRSAKAVAEGLINDNPVGRGVGEIIGPALSGQFGDFGQKFLRGQVRSFVPGILRDLAKLQDSTARIPDDTSFSSQINADFRSGNPWTRSSLEPRLDAMGRPVKEANPFLPYRSIEDVPRRRELEEMRRLGTGPSAEKREKGTSASDFNKQVSSRAAQTKAALDRIAPGQAVRSDAARARVYASGLTSAAMKRADKLSDGSVQAKYDIEALRADAYSALRELPAYQALSDRQKEAARKRVDERLKGSKARAASSRAGEKAAALPDASGRDLAREAISSR